MAIKRNEYQNIHINELKPGMFVTIDLSWIEHPFLTNSFKIKDKNQIDILIRLGLKSIRYCPIKSDKILTVTDDVIPANQSKANPTRSETDPLEAVIISSKKARIDRLNYHKQSVIQCEKKLLEAAKVIKKVEQELFSRSKESIYAASDLIRQMTDSLLTNKDVTIHAINDKITGEDAYYHSLNVSILSMLLAKQLKLPQEAINLVGMGGIFHDIGKMKIPEKIVQKKGTLSSAESNFLKLHPVYGKKIGEEIKLPSSIVEIIYNHHETINGTGYPNGINQESLKLTTQIVAIANTFDNLCNHKDISKTLTPYEAVSTLYSKYRANYDSTALGAFILQMGVYPPGTLVMLSNDYYGIVISVNTGQPLKPSVLIYDPEIPKQEAIIIDFLDEPELNIVKTYHPKDLPKEVVNYLDPRKRHTFAFHEASNSSK